jgi:hypothetical protein
LSDDEYAATRVGYGSIGRLLDRHAHGRQAGRCQILEPGSLAQSTYISSCYGCPQQYEGLASNAFTWTQRVPPIPTLLALKR